MRSGFVVKLYYICMKLRIGFACALIAFTLCALMFSGCSGAAPSSVPAPNASNSANAAPWHIPNAMPSPKPSASKTPAASPTPCQKTYLVPGTNGAPDELRPCESPTPKPTPEAKPANANE
jgi:hypothetical protein